MCIQCVCLFIYSVCRTCTSMATYTLHTVYALECSDVDTDCSLIKEVMEYVVGLESLLPSLFVAKDEVNPLVKVGRHVVTF